MKGNEYLSFVLSKTVTHSQFTAGNLPPLFNLPPSRRSIHAKRSLQLLITLWIRTVVQNSMKP